MFRRYICLPKSPIFLPADTPPRKRKKKLMQKPADTCKNELCASKLIGYGQTQNILFSSPFPPDIIEVAKHSEQLIEHLFRGNLTEFRQGTIAYRGLDRTYSMFQVTKTRYRHYVVSGDFNYNCLVSNSIWKKILYMYLVFCYSTIIWGKCSDTIFAR